MNANRIPTQAGATCICRTCGATTPTSQARVSGVWSALNGTTVWDCDMCTLEHLQEIEAGTDPAHW